MVRGFTSTRTKAPRGFVRGPARGGSRSSPRLVDDDEEDEEEDEDEDGMEEDDNDGPGLGEWYVDVDGDEIAGNDDDEEEDEDEDEDEERDGDDDDDDEEVGNLGVDGGDLGTDIDEHFWDQGDGESPKKRPRRGPRGPGRKGRRLQRREWGVGNVPGAGTSRRSRRMKPLDVTRELVVLMPGDDPVEKLGLEDHELPEFICCMEEEFKYDEVDQALGLRQGSDDRGNHGHGHSRAEVHVEDGADVPVPEVSIDPSVGAVGAGGARGSAGPKKRSGGWGLAHTSSSSSLAAAVAAASGSASLGPFFVGRMGDYSQGSTYTTYELDSDDEDFLHSIGQSEAAGTGAGAGAGAGGGLGADFGEQAAVKPKGKPGPKPKGAFGSEALDPRFAALVSQDMLESMIEGLEREMHLSLSYAAGRSEVEQARSRCVDCIQSSEKMCEVVEQSLPGVMASGSSSSSGGGGGGNVKNDASKCAEKLEKIVKEDDNRAELNSQTLAAAQVAAGGASGHASRPGSPRGADSPRPGSPRPDDNGKNHPIPSGYHRGGSQRERELPRYTKEQIEVLVSPTEAVTLLARVFNAHTSSGSKSSHNGAGAAAASAAGGSPAGKRGGENYTETELRPLLLRIFDYWATKRASLKVSLLRCYHQFIMENWKIQSDVLPVLPEDRDATALAAAHAKLVKLRRDLDRARLIVDRVRRREKIKRELVRVAGDALDTYVDGLAVDDNEDLAEETEVKEKASAGKAGKKEAAAAAVAPVAERGGVRAAKQEAREKLAATGTANKGLAKSQSAGSMQSALGGRDRDIQSHEDSDFDDSILPFSLDEVDYDALEMPPANAPQAFGRGELDTDNFDRRRHPNGRRFGPVSSPAGGGGGGGSSATGWTGDEDHLLLLGVAACGVGRWTEIREDFLLARNSAQMNQRFTRLARRRCMLVKITGTGNSSSSLSGNGKRSGKGSDSDEDEDEGNEYTEVRTAFVSPADVQLARSKLPPILVEMLEKYQEDAVWESIALRHLFDTQSKEKRCGRPQKYPLPIPIPKHLQNGGWQSRKKNLVQRPSTLVPGWQPGSGGGYGVGVGTYQPNIQFGSTKQANGGVAPAAYTGRPRGRPRKYRPPEPDPSDEDDDNDSDSSGEKEDAATRAAKALQKKKEEQDKMRIERALARAQATTEAEEENSGLLSRSDSTASLLSLGVRKAGAAARCSLGSLPSKDKRGAGSEDENEDEEDEGEGDEEEDEDEASSGSAGAKRGRRSPRLVKSGGGRRVSRRSR